MKVTTVRFGDDLWTAISSEAERAGVSASQFIREAALARAAAAAGARGEVLFDSAAIREAAIWSEVPDKRQRELENALAALERALAEGVRTDAAAVRAESQQARRATAARRARQAGRER